jgi:hypothetical protein
MARLEEAEFTPGTYIRMGIAAILGAPILWVITVLFLAMGEAPR